MSIGSQFDRSQVGKATMFVLLFRMGDKIGVRANCDANAALLSG